MEDFVPAQWIGEEDTFEQNLEEHAKFVISTGKRKARLVADAVDTGLCLPGLPSPLFLDLSTLVFLGGSASLPLSAHVVCVGGPQTLAPGWLCDPGLANQSITCL